MPGGAGIPGPAWRSPSRRQCRAEPASPRMTGCYWSNIPAGRKEGGSRAVKKSNHRQNRLREERGEETGRLERTALPSPGENGLSNYQRLPLCGQEDGNPVRPRAPGATTLPGAGSPPQPPPKCNGRGISRPPSKSHASQEQQPHPRAALQVLRVKALVVLP